MSTQFSISPSGNIIIDKAGNHFEIGKTFKIGISIQNHSRHCLWIGEVKYKVSERMSNQFTMIYFQTLNDVGMMNNHKVCSMENDSQSAPKEWQDQIAVEAWEAMHNKEMTPEIAAELGLSVTPAKQN